MQPTFQETIEYNFDSETRKTTYQGDFGELNGEISNSLTAGGKAGEDAVYTNLLLTRREAGRGVLEKTVRICNGLSWWGVSFAEVSKPIKTWLAMKNPDNLDSVHTELNKIDLWEQQKSEGPKGMQNYLKFCYDGKNTLSGDTLELAKKILRGIETYSIYQPVATCRRTQCTPFTDGLGAIGRWTHGLSSPSGQIECNEGQLAAISAIKPIWLKTGDEITQNTDGTLTRTETWMGLDDIDKDLYEMI